MKTTHFRRRFKLSISIKLSIMFLIISVVPITILIYYMNYYAYNLLLEKESDNASLLANTLSENLNNAINDSYRSLNSIPNIYEIMSCLKNPLPSNTISLEQFYREKQINEYLRILTAAGNQTSRTVTIIDSRDNVYSNGQGMIYREELLHDIKYIISKKKYGISMFSRRVDNDDVITIGRIIKDEEGVGIGIAYEDIPYEEVLPDMDLGLTDEISIFCKDTAGHIFFAYNPLNIDQTILKVSNQGDNNLFQWMDSSHLVLVRKETGKTFRVFIVASQKNVFRDSDHFENNIIIILIVFLLWALFCTILISNTFTRPIVKLSKKMHLFTDKLEPIYFDKSEITSDEMGDLLVKSSEMSGEILQLMEKEKKYNNEKRNYELAALRAQINPHMIYNTLNTITFLAQLQGVDNICEISKAFSDLLHMQLKNIEDYTSLEKAIDYLQKYLQIKKYNMICELELREDIPEEMKNCDIIPFLLQPFAENSIKHGFANRTKKGIILVRVNKTNGWIHLELCDNGNGIEKEILQKIQNQLIRITGISPEKQIEHIGIINSAKRFFTVYEYHCSIKISSKEGHYTKIELEYPENWRDYGRQ